MLETDFIEKVFTELKINIILSYIRAQISLVSSKLGLRLSAQTVGYGAGFILLLLVLAAGYLVYLCLKALGIMR